MKKIISTIALLAAGPLTAGCGNTPGLPNLPDLPDNPVCSLECRTFATSGGSISGIVSVDAFFGAVLNFQAQARSLEADVKAELLSIAGILELDVGADASVSDISAAIAAEIDGNFGGRIDGGIRLEFQEPKCEVTAQATIEASAKCDVEVDPGSATVECKGECVAEANVMAECSGSAELQCKGTAPSFQCEGTCQGTCEVQAGAVCEGECTGTCEVTSEAECDGEFTATTDDGASGSGTCKLRAGARCSGMCRGSCELNAGATCEGECKGECTYTAPEAGCTGGAQASCSASGDASVECKGECKGEVDPPEVSAECQATAKAEADFKAECTPPSVGIAYDLSASAEGDFSTDVNAKAAFEAKIEAFGAAYGRLLAKGAKLELVLNAGSGLLSAGGEAVLDAASSVAANADRPAAAFGAACAVTALGNVSGQIDSGVNSLTASANAIASVSTAIGG